MSKYIMALDEGTTSCRCILFDKDGNTKSTASREITQIYPKPGWVEHDASEIWTGQRNAVMEALEKIGASTADIAGIGITNQRETTVVWDKNTGLPVYNAIVWQCRRTADYCDSLIAQGLADKIKEKTGLLIDPYFSGTKIRWILENVPGAREKAERGDLLFGTMETWLIWKMTNGKVHVTDYSNASRTMIFNIHTLDWDDELLEILDIPKSMLPKPMPSSCIYGETDPEIMNGVIPISGAAGDQQCALFGQACFKGGQVKSTFGTGGFLLMNTGEQPIESKNGLLTTVAWGLDGKVFYALEGSIFVAAAALQFLKDQLGLMEHSYESESIAMSIPDTGGVYMVPAFVGLGTPYWDPYARGLICGLTRGTTKEQIIRAALESIAYQTVDVLKAMEQDSGLKLDAIKVDGGVSANNFFLQFLSDLTQTEVKRPYSIETTSLGAAYLAGLAVGYWENVEEIEKNWKSSARFSSSMAEEVRKEKLDGWHKAVQRTLL